MSTPVPEWSATEANWRHHFRTHPDLLGVAARRAAHAEIRGFSLNRTGSRLVVRVRTDGTTHQLKWDVSRLSRPEDAHKLPSLVVGALFEAVYPEFRSTSTRMTAQGDWLYKSAGAPAAAALQEECARLGSDFCDRLVAFVREKMGKASSQEDLHQRELAFRQMTGPIQSAIKHGASVEDVVSFVREVCNQVVVEEVLKS